MTDKLTYLETHPWIKFEYNSINILPQTWIKLGECASKCEQIADVPLKPDTKENLYLIYLSKGVQATTAIEGNTLTEEQIKDIIEKKSNIPESQKYQEYEVKNIIKVCNKIAVDVFSNVRSPITTERICEYNQIVLENTSYDDWIEPGVLRNRVVGVPGYKAPHHQYLSILMKKLCNWLNSDLFKPGQGENQIVYAIIKAIIAHIYIAWIHPFGDGNGRTARLIEFEILAFSGVPLPAAHLLSNHYNMTRTEYYRQLSKTSKSRGNIIDFICYAVQGFNDGLKNQILLIREQQIDVALENFIHEQFRGKKGELWQRRRFLALDLSKQENPIKKEEIPTISTRLYNAYKYIHPRAITRDLQELIKMDLVQRIEKAYRVKKEIILEFLPPRIDI